MNQVNRFNSDKRKHFFVPPALILNNENTAQIQDHKTHLMYNFQLSGGSLPGSVWFGQKLKIVVDNLL